MNIVEMIEKNQAVYIAKKNDPIDRALGNWVNRYPERKKL